MARAGAVTAVGRKSAMMLRGILVLLWARMVLGGSQFERIGCFVSAPPSYGQEQQSSEQSQGSCNAHCARANTKYFALKAGAYCICGDANPSSLASSVNGCRVPCLGYDIETCGGQDAFEIFLVNRSHWMITDGGAAATTAGGAAPVADASTGATPTAGGAGNPTAVASVGGGSAGATPTAGGMGNPAEAAPINDGGGERTVVKTLTSDEDVTLTSPHQVTASVVIATTKQVNLPPSTSNSTPVSRSRGPAMGVLVGAIVGGLLGLILLGLALLFALRRISARRDQERMEKEYQEAIKPIEYDDSLDYVESANFPRQLPGKHVELADSTRTDPFDDNRRISVGSLPVTSPVPKNNVLTVVNPDE